MLLQKAAAGTCQGGQVQTTEETPFVQQDSQHDHLVTLIHFGRFQHFQPVSKLLLHTKFVGGQVAFLLQKAKPAALFDGNQARLQAVSKNFRHAGAVVAGIAQGSVRFQGLLATFGKNILQKFSGRQFHIQQAARRQFRWFSVQPAAESGPAAVTTVQRQQLHHPLREDAMIANKIQDQQS